MISVFIKSKQNTQIVFIAVVDINFNVLRSHIITSIKLSASKILVRYIAEKLSFIEQLDKKDKIAFYAVLDAFIGKKKLKDALSNVLSDVK